MRIKKQNLPGWLVYKMTKKIKQLEVKETIIHITQHNKDDYISLTDIAFGLVHPVPIRKGYV